MRQAWTLWQINAVCKDDCGECTTLGYGTCKPMLDAILKHLYRYNDTTLERVFNGA